MLSLPRSMVLRRLGADLPDSGNVDQLDFLKCSILSENRRLRAARQPRFSEREDRNAAGFWRVPWVKRQSTGSVVTVDGKRKTNALQLVVLRVAVKCALIGSDKYA